MASKPTKEPLYSVIVVDPPWQQMGGPLKTSVDEGFVFDGPSRSQELPYPTMHLRAIEQLPVGSLAARNCALYLWTTNHYLPYAFQLLNYWGFRYSTTIVWTKAPIGKGLGGAWGISTEFVLYARQGSPLEKTKHGSTWYGWKRPYDKRGKPKHSGKSPALQDLIEEMHDGPYLEMFAREQRLGWDTWGDQALQHVELRRGETVLAEDSSVEVLGKPPASADDVARTPRTSTTYFGETHAFTVDEYDDGEVRIS